MKEYFTKAVITLSPDKPYADCEFLRENGSVVSKRSSLENFYEKLFLAIHSDDEQQTALAEGYLFPSNLIALRRGFDGRTFKAYYHVPAGKKIMNLYNAKTCIPFPNLLFEIFIKNGLANNCRVFALKSSEVFDSTELYHYPFGNVYENGKICFGGNETKGINNPTDALRVISKFFGSETNNDLWNLESKVTKKGYKVKTQIGLVDAIKDMEEYPKEWLVDTRYTVSTLLKE